MAELADPRCKNPKEIIAKSLAGNWNEDLLFTLKQSYELYQFIEKQIIECETKMEALFRKYSSQIPTQKDAIVRSEKQIQKKTKVAFDVEEYAYQIFGVNLMRIPGINPTCRIFPSK